MIYFSTLLISIFITIAFVPIFKNLAVRMKAVDMPEPRKVHSVPMPKTGGVAMAIGALIPVLFWAPADDFLKSVLLGAGVIVVFGVLDDLKNLGYKAKFFGQVVAALLVIFYGQVEIKSLGMLLPEGVLLPDFIAIPLTLVFIIGVTNAINLADGLDGLAGGISLITFICIGFLAYLGGYSGIAVISLAMIGSIFGFLRFNTFPATVFMGDAGSQLIGFLAGTLSVQLTQASVPLSPFLPLLLLGFPILDTISVMSERISEGRSPFVADKRHFHHKLISLGMFHTEAVFTIYVLQSCFVTAAYIFRFYSDWTILAIYLSFSGFILVSFFILERIGWQINRHDIIDEVIKKKLRILKERQLVVKFSFRIFYAGLPLLFIFSCAIPSDVPIYFAIFAAVMALFNIVPLLVESVYPAMAARLALYFVIPFVVFLGEAYPVDWLSDMLNATSIGYYIVMVVLMLFTLKFTRRTKGFKTSPMDYLIIFVAIIVPNLPDQVVRSYQLGLIATKIIVLFFCYEVLIGELRGRLKWVNATTAAGLAILAGKGFLGL